MLSFFLNILLVICYAAAIILLVVTITLLGEGEIAAAIFSAIVTAIPVLIIWLTFKKLKKISDAKEEELDRLTPEQFTLIVIVEHKDDIDQRTEDIADRLFEMDNLGSMYEYTINEVREAVPYFYVDKYPMYLIVKDSPNEDIKEMLGSVRAKGTDAEPLLRFLQEELRKYERKLNAGRETKDRP